MEVKDYSEALLNFSLNDFGQDLRTDTDSPRTHFLV